MLLPDPSAFQVIQSTSNQQSLVFTLKSVRPNSVCPACGQGSTRQHSRYRRTIADLPWADLTVRLFLHVRRFFCVNLECTRRIFCERLPEVVARYARKT